MGSSANLRSRLFDIAGWIVYAIMMAVILVLPVALWFDINFVSITSVNVRVTCYACQASGSPFSGSFTNNGQSTNLQAPNNLAISFPDYQRYSWNIQRNGAKSWNVSFIFTKNSDPGTLEIDGVDNRGIFSFGACTNASFAVLAGSFKVTGNTNAELAPFEGYLSSCPDGD